MTSVGLKWKAIKNWKIKIKNEPKTYHHQEKGKPTKTPLSKPIYDP
jgi:hypothetical protein